MITPTSTRGSGCEPPYQNEFGRNVWNTRKAKEEKFLNGMWMNIPTFLERYIQVSKQVLKLYFFYV
jgi:hypothetical protein